jgi:uncharacterized protein
MIIDCHTHVFPPRIKENRAEYVGRDICFAALYGNPRARIITVDELIIAMDEAGIAMSVIAGIGWTTPELCAESNDYIMAAVARYPERLIGFGAVPPLSPQAIPEIERCARGGLRGIGEIRPDVQQINLADTNALAPFTGAMIKNNLVLLTHASEPVGHAYPGKGEVTPQQLYPFITAFPDLKIVCAHWGGGLPFYALMPEVKRALGNVYFDSAASPLLYSPTVYREVINLLGADRILFGSDFPLLLYNRALREIDGLGLSETQQEFILSGNARRLFGITKGI